MATRSMQPRGSVIETPLLPFLALLITAQPVLPLGVRIPNQDAEAIARGNAWAATADNPAAIYYNPAGISQLEGQNFHVGSLFYLNIYTDYESPSGQRFENEHKVTPVPELHYTYSPKDFPLSFGLGIYAPFGLGMQWPNDAPFRNAGIEANLKYLTVNPVISWKALPTLSLAIGPTFNYSELRFRQGVPLPPFLGANELHFEGDDWAYGFTAGALWQPHPKWSFGLKYMSATSEDYDGTGSFHGPAASFLPQAGHTTAKVDFPQIVAGGISFRPTTNWNFEVDVDWSDWESVNNLRVQGVANATTVLNWNSSFFYEFGATYQLGKGFFVSAGYFFSEASTPEKNYIPLVPDTDLHVGSLGFGYHGRHWDFALAGQYIAGGFREVNNATDPTVNGRYRIMTPTVSFSVGYHF